VASHSASSSRAAQRLQTQERILSEARRLFAEAGFASTTIRGVATAAEVDPALVMRYFGSKEKLFAEAARVDPDEPAEQNGTSDVAEQVLESLRQKLEAEPVAMLAMLRSMLTHQGAGEGVRNLIAQRQHQLGQSIDTDEPQLRTGLISAVLLGVVVSRYLLELDGVRDAPAGQIIELLRPCVHGLIGLPDDDQGSQRGVVAHGHGL
jgi:AcrR family transcriptional regulator